MMTVLRLTRLRVVLTIIGIRRLLSTTIYQIDLCANSNLSYEAKIGFCIFKWLYS